MARTSLFDETKDGLQGGLVGDERRMLCAGIEKVQIELMHSMCGCGAVPAMLQVSLVKEVTWLSCERATGALPLCDL